MDWLHIYYEAGVKYTYLNMDVILGYNPTNIISKIKIGRPVLL